MTISAKYPGRCSVCERPIVVGDKIKWERGKHAQHSVCPKRTESVASVMREYEVPGGKVLDGYDFKPDAHPTTERCARCGRRGSGVAWISGAGEALCYRHQDDY